MGENERSARLLEAALDYADRGWRVLPLHDMSRGVCSCRHGEKCLTPGKHPRLAKWEKWATCDKGTIAGWWKQWPSANVGIKTGADSGLVVLDIDPRHGGFETLAGFLPLPEGPTVNTGGGGRHFYFADPGGTVKGFDVGDGVELKADAQFVVAPPSRTGDPPP
jgi:putative DNA primase/helicase